MWLAIGRTRQLAVKWANPLKTLGGYGRQKQDQKDPHGDRPGRDNFQPTGTKKRKPVSIHRWIVQTVQCSPVSRLDIPIHVTALKLRVILQPVRSCPSEKRRAVRFRTAANQTPTLPQSLAVTALRDSGVRGVEPVDNQGGWASYPPSYGE